MVFRYDHTKFSHTVLAMQWTSVPLKYIEQMYVILLHMPCSSGQAQDNTVAKHRMDSAMLECNCHTSFNGRSATESPDIGAIPPELGYCVIQKCRQINESLIPNRLKYDHGATTI